MRSAVTKLVPLSCLLLTASLTPVLAEPLATPSTKDDASIVAMLIANNTASRDRLNSLDLKVKQVYTITEPYIDGLTEWEADWPKDTLVSTIESELYTTHEGLLFLKRNEVLTIGGGPKPWKLDRFVRVLRNNKYVAEQIAVSGRATSTIRLWEHESIQRPQQDSLSCLGSCQPFVLDYAYGNGMSSLSESYERNKAVVEWAADLVELEGEEVYRLEQRFIDRKRGESRKNVIYIDPHKDFSTLRVECYDLNSMLTDLINVRLQLQENVGMWLPVEVTNQSFIEHKITARGRLLEIKAVAGEHDFAFNLNALNVEEGTHLTRVRRDGQPQAYEFVKGEWQLRKKLDNQLN